MKYFYLSFRYILFILLLLSFFLHAQNDFHYQDIVFHDQNHGWILKSNGELLRTINGGKTWEKSNAPPGNMFFVDTSNGWIILDDSAFYTNNGGETWTFASNIPANYWTVITFINDSLGFLYGAFVPDSSETGPVLLKTEDSGYNWHHVVLDSNFLWWEPIQSIKFANNGTGYAIMHQTILKTYNFGEIWEVIDFEFPRGGGFYPEEFYTDLQLINEDTVFATYWTANFPAGHIIYTINGGETWQPVEMTQIMSADFGDFYSDQYLNIWLVSGSILYHSTNFGSKWDTLQTFDINYLGNIIFSDPLTSWIFAGHNILYTNNGWLTYEFIVPLIASLKDNDIQIKQSNLQQNYPNPFNPQTVINYQLAMNSNVELVIYNVLGKEITTLVSEAQSAGEYSVPFDASYLASGVYFYRLKAGDYISYKKMMLLK